MEENRIPAKIYLVIITLSLISVTLFYFILEGWGDIKSSTIGHLLLNLLPNLIATALTTFFVILIFDYRSKREAKLIIKSDYHYHNWSKYIHKARKIDIVANYFDSWLRKYELELIEFLKRGGKIRIIMTKSENIDEMRFVLRRFPDMADGLDDLNYRINHTVKTIEELVKKSIVNKKNVEIYFHNWATYYPVIRIDDRLIIFSYFKHNINDIFEAPSVLINVEDETVTRSFWANEYEFLFKNSEKFEYK